MQGQIFSSKLKRLFLLFFLLLFVGGITYEIYQYFYWSSYKPKPGSCIFLEQRYCNQVTFITLRVNGKDVPFGAYNLPKNTPIFAPFQDNNLMYLPKGTKTANGTTSQMPYVSTISQNPIKNNIINETQYFFYYNYHKENLVTQKIKNGVLDNLGTNPVYQNYNLLVSVIQTSSAAIHPSNYGFFKTDVTRKLLSQ